MAAAERAFGEQPRAQRCDRRAELLGGGREVVLDQRGQAPDVVARERLVRSATRRARAHRRPARAARVDLGRARARLPGQARTIQAGARSRARLEPLAAAARERRVEAGGEERDVGAHLARERDQLVRRERLRAASRSRAAARRRRRRFPPPSPAPTGIVLVEPHPPARGVAARAPPGAPSARVTSESPPVSPGASTRVAAAGSSSTTSPTASAASTVATLVVAIRPRAARRAGRG